MVRTVTLVGTPGVFGVSHPDLAYIRKVIKVQRSGIEFDPWFTTIDGELVNPGNRQYYHSNSDGFLYFNNENPFTVSPPNLGPGPSIANALINRLEKIHVIYETL